MSETTLSETIANLRDRMVFAVKSAQDIHDTMQSVKNRRKKEELKAQAREYLNEYRRLKDQEQHEYDQYLLQQKDVPDDGQHHEPGNQV